MKTKKRRKNIRNNIILRKNALDNRPPLLNFFNSFKKFLILNFDSLPITFRVVIPMKEKKLMRSHKKLINAKIRTTSH